MWIIYDLFIKNSYINGCLHNLELNFYSFNILIIDKDFEYFLLLSASLLIIYIYIYI